ncbi:hypothetical protein [Bacillus sp. OK048]|uniref:hypothetical protein n=1 Tax=Bacillus sp. OK048 TaxID=1882761 RepID=UPI00087F2F3D|nr:hypothetical protein [Bacillus sp. OK048]SDM17897.1 hypothetical protein SAMN05443253_102188 [Bacillus sp. OK048]
MARKQSDFAVYRGEEFQFIGSADECAEFLGVKKNIIYLFSSPSYQKKVANPKRNRETYITVIKLDEEEE